MIKRKKMFSKSTDAMKWIKCNRSLPPEDMLHDPSVQNASGYTCAMLWILKVSPNVPEELHHDPDIQSLHKKETCAMMYINKCKTANVPTWMEHDGNIRDIKGRTCAMLIDDILGINEIPDWMFHDPELQDKDGNTLLGNHIIKYGNLNVNKHFIHHPSVTNNIGYNITMLCIKYGIRDIPKVLIDTDVTEYKNINGTYLYLYQKYILPGPVPAFIINTVNHTYSDGNTALMHVIKEYDGNRYVNYNDPLIDIIDIFLQYHDLSIVNNANETVISLLLENKYTIDIIKYIISQPSISFPDDVMEIIREKYIDNIVWKQEYYDLALWLGIDVNDTSYGLTLPMMFCNCSSCYGSIIYHGYDYDIKCEDDTLLTYIFKNKRLSINKRTFIDIFLNTDPNFTTPDGDTPLMCLYKNHRRFISSEVVKAIDKSDYLDRYNKFHRNNDNYTALIIMLMYCDRREYVLTSLLDSIYSDGTLEIMLASFNKRHWYLSRQPTDAFNPLRTHIKDNKTSLMLFCTDYNRESDFIKYDYLLHDPALQDKNGNTCAMLLIKSGVRTIPEYLRHDPSIQNNNGNTCAMLLIQSRIKDIPEYLRHDPSIQNNNGNTCAMLLIKSGVRTIPEYLRHDPSIQNNNGNTCAMYFLSRIKDIPEYLRHDPSIQNNNGNTCAMLLISRLNIHIIPEYLRHDPLVRNKDGMTCAMLMLTCPGIRDVPEYLRHNPSVQNKDGMTCAMILLKNRKPGIALHFRHEWSLKDSRGWVCYDYWRRWCRGGLYDREIQWLMPPHSYLIDYPLVVKDNLFKIIKCSKCQTQAMFKLKDEHFCDKCL